jgi:hypothetical protein
MSCWLAQFTDVPCHGRLVKAHLIPAQRIKRELPSMPRRERDDIVWDQRVWVPMCGGLTGLSGQHGMMDSKQILVPRSRLPEGLEAFAVEYGLVWSLDRDFGLRQAA